MFNGVKVLIVFEEMGLVYEFYLVILFDVDVKSFEFLLLNLNNKIFVIIDLNGLDGVLVGFFESGVILIYFVEKIGKLIGNILFEKVKIIQWLMFQMGGLGLMFGQMGFFVKFVGLEIEDLCLCECYVSEVKCLFVVLEKEFLDKDWIVGEYFIVDIVIVFWLVVLEFYQVKDFVGWDELLNVNVYLECFFVCLVV